jgi:hypothetical protein
MTLKVTLVNESSTAGHITFDDVFAFFSSLFVVVVEEEEEEEEEAVVSLEEGDVIAAENASISGISRDNCWMDGVH